MSFDLTPRAAAPLSLVSRSGQPVNSVESPHDVGDVPVWDGSGWDFLNGALDVRVKGAVGDGETDDAAAFTAAAEAAETVVCPAGTYLLDCDNGELTPDRTGRIRFVGAGKDATVLKLSRSLTAEFTAFNATDREIIFEDLTLDVDLAASSTFLVLTWGDGGTIRLRNVRCLGRTEESEGARSHIAYLVNSSDGASDVAETLEIRDVYASGWSGVFLKDNASSSRQKLVDVRGLVTENMFGVDLLVNSPVGQVDRVVVDGFTSIDNLGGTTSTNDHRFSCAGAGVDSVRLSNFDFSGTGQGLHWEEGAGPGVVSNGIIEVEGDEDAVFLTGNDEGGVTQRIENLSFENLFLRHTGSPTAARGFHIASSATSINVDKLKLSNVTIENFNVGIRVPGSSTVDSTLFETANVHIKNCATGLLANRVFPGMRGITFEDCDVPINATQGGTMGVGTVFVDCPVGATATSANGYVVLPGFTAVRRNVSVTGSSSSTDIAFCEKPLWIYGNVAANLGQTSFKAAALLQCEWDGSTLTTSRRATVSSGAVAWSNSAVIDDATSFLARIFNSGSTITGEEIMLSFDGLAAFS